MLKTEEEYKEFGINLIRNGFEIDYESLDQIQKPIYTSLKTLYAFKVPYKLGKIVYDKENWKEYCNIIKEAIKNKQIDIDNDRTYDIYKRFKSDKLPERWCLHIIRNIVNDRRYPRAKTERMTRLDNQYINEIIDCANQILHKCAKINPLIETMKKFDMTVDQVIDLIFKSVQNS